MKSEKDISELVSRLIEVYFRFPGGVAKKWGIFGIVNCGGRWKMFGLEE